MSDYQRISRKRGRPSTATKKALEVYPGASLDDVLSMDDKTVEAHFKELNVEPKPHRWPSEPDQWFTELVKVGDGHTADNIRYPTKEELKAHRVQWDADNARLVRIQLASAFIDRWVTGLEHSDLIAQLESRSEERFSESSIRYGSLERWRMELASWIFSEAVASSTKYEQPVPMGLDTPTPKTKGRKKV